MSRELEEAFQTLRPIQDYVAVARIEAEKKSKGGIIIPDSVAEHYRSFMGRIVAVGPGRFNEAGDRLPMTPELTVGAVVCFGRYAGGESALQDADFWLIRETEIDAVIDDPNDVSAMPRERT